MPAPDPESIWLEETGLHWRITHFSWAWGNETLKKRRAVRLLRLYARPGGWHCRHCGDLMPEYKRADAVYCSESCRKRDAQRRRSERATLIDVR